MVAGRQFCSGSVGWAKRGGTVRRADRSRIARGEAGRVPELASKLTADREPIETTIDSGRTESSSLPGRAIPCGFSLCACLFGRLRSDLTAQIEFLRGTAQEPDKQAR